MIAGEYKGIYNHLEVENAVRRVIRDIGYEQDGFHWETADITNLYARTVSRHRPRHRHVWCW
jgi:S-adenosylmethionine synthetase